MGRVFVSLFLAAFMIVSAGHSQPQAKKRIAVFEFEDKSDHEVRWWRDGQHVGQGMSDMLVTELVKSDKYIVVERDKIQSIMQEQALGASGAITQQTAAQVGKLLGVEVAVFGAVTEYGFKSQDVEASVGSGLRKKLKIGALKGGGVEKHEVRIGIDVRMVNTTSGQILASESVATTKASRGLKVSTDFFDFSNQKAFDESIVGKAMREAIEQVVVKIDNQMATVAWAGMVIKAETDAVIINAGTATGLMIGDELDVFSKGEELVDPATGLSLGSEETKIGKIKVVSDMADGKASKCSIIDGSGGKRGDIIRYPN